LPEGFVVQLHLPPVEACEFDFDIDEMTAVSIEELPIG